MSDIADDIVQCVTDIKAETANEDIIIPDADKFASAQSKFDDKDTSGDGFLDLAEVEAAALDKVTTAFDNMDADDNDEVTLEEFLAHKESIKATRRAVKSCIDELTAEEE